MSLKSCLTNSSKTENASKTPKTNWHQQLINRLEQKCNKHLLQVQHLGDKYIFFLPYNTLGSDIGRIIAASEVMALYISDVDDRPTAKPGLAPSFARSLLPIKYSTYKPNLINLNHIW